MASVRMCSSRGLSRGRASEPRRQSTPAALRGRPGGEAGRTGNCRGRTRRGSRTSLAAVLSARATGPNSATVRPRCSRTTSVISSRLASMTTRRSLVPASVPLALRGDLGRLNRTAVTDRGLHRQTKDSKKPGDKRATAAIPWLSPRTIASNSSAQSALIRGMCGQSADGIFVVTRIPDSPSAARAASAARSPPASARALSVDWRSRGWLPATVCATARPRRVGPARRSGGTMSSPRRGPWDRWPRPGR